MPENEKDKVLLLEKGKNGLLRVIFGRTMVIILLLAVQIFIMIYAFGSLVKYIPYFWGVYILTTFICILVIINRPYNPCIQVSWLILILTVPVIGIGLYLYVDTQLGYRYLNRCLNQRIQETGKLLSQDPAVLHAIEQEDGGRRGTINICRYAMQHGGFPVYVNTETEYYPMGELAFPYMLEALEGAETFIFIEYFIVREGYMWGRILKILEEKVKEGVEVRVMYDGTCAVTLLPYGYPAELEKLGIQCKMFSPLRPVLSTHYNNRDHRKIMVVDGKVGFTGGLNLADNYINLTHPYGVWKDNAIRIQGEAVQSLTMMFLQMWNIHKPGENYEAYLNKQSIVEKTAGYIMPYGDNPLDDENVAEMIYIDILNRAERYVHIMTPYLIIDNEMLTALTFAAKRGVEVILILPYISDGKAVDALAKSYYKQLIRGGVQIYEYMPGFVHSKVFVSDDVSAVVGTINLDYRSLYHHFECAVYLHRCPSVAEVEADIQQTLRESKQITEADWKRVRLYKRAAGRVLRLIAPLM